MRLVILVCIAIMLSGCVATKKKPPAATTSRYSLKDDIGPHAKEKLPDISKIPNAVPKAEPKSKIGNPKTYTVFNKKYNVLSTSKGYKARGKASWYGKKFHGYKTSNGEVYDMYSMTAAHKTLPLPTYLKVTNLKNKRVVIVKVNDRGPFHGDRILDLSYAAATKLGILQHGVGEVEIEAITTPILIPQNYLQIGAFSHHDHAKKLADKLQKHAKNHKITIRKNKLYHVHIGPIDDETVMLDLKKTLKANNFTDLLEVQVATK